ncbi:hypothetical protein PV327_002362 [Microctonus hyperodae]|uniref:Transmembrane protein n=1 Tax=Microctonus hyperodae TaxID=165561 RepID=A0AA39KP42_MICHY|nr:hypothetical protein PV327_002362 [Microctonus hyperodae]
MRYGIIGRWGWEEGRKRDRDNEECGGMLQDLSDKINNKHQEVHTHPLLSIFKMAEVEVKLPHNSEATISTRASIPLLLILFITVTIVGRLNFMSQLYCIVLGDLTS